MMLLIVAQTMTECQNSSDVRFGVAKLEMRKSERRKESPKDKGMGESTVTSNQKQGPRQRSRSPPSRAVPEPGRTCRSPTQVSTT